jgi:predicted metal-dependent hydrolase
MFSGQSFDAESLSILHKIFEVVWAEVGPMTNESNQLTARQAIAKALIDFGRVELRW